MELKQFYLGCLAHASYLVGDGDECVVVDPQRDVQSYLDAAKERGMRITHVVETHLHADFVSGHRELAELTGATIVFGRAAGAAFPHRAVADGDEIRVGTVVLRVMETPGHTPESICLAVIDPSRRKEPVAVLTGDTLFIGDAGRPDLVAAAGRTPQEMAAQLHASLQRLLELPDDCEVLPAHGAGSLCGRNISSELTSTIGAQRRTNPALQPMSTERFVEMMTKDLPEQPPYFASDARLNREGPQPIRSRPPPPIVSPEDVDALAAGGATVIDVRPAAEYAAAHVPGSVGIGLSGQFASWAGTLLPLDRPVVVVAASQQQADEAHLRLSRVGIDGVAGAVVDGLAAWRASGRPLASVATVDPAGLAALLATAEPPRVLDVRREREHAQGHVPGAVNVPLDRLASSPPQLESGRPVAVICQSGYRSTAALGLLERAGLGPLLNVEGGTAAWLAAGLPSEGSGASGTGAACSLGAPAAPRT